MADKAREDRHPVVPAAQHDQPSAKTSTGRAPRSPRRRSGDEAAVAHLEVIDPGNGLGAESEPPSTDATGDLPEGRREPLRIERTIRSTPAVYRWVCPCQDPPVLLATYGPQARINIKVRDRYWHLHGFGMVEAICPRCAAEHVLDLRNLHRALETGEEPLPMRRSS